MTLAISLIAIVGAIVVGWKFKFNTGVLAMGLAFIIGYFGLSLGISDIIKFWPLTIVFYLIVVSLLFNYMTVNGTVEILAKKLLYAMNGNAKLIPVAIALTSAIVGAIGGGPATPAIMGPFAFSIGLTAGLNPILIAACIMFGSMIGLNNPINGLAMIVGKGLLVESNGVDADTAATTMNMVYVDGVIICLIMLVVCYVVFRGFKAEKVDLTEEIPDFNPVQKKTLAVILIAFVAMIVPALVNAIFATPETKFVAQFCQPQAIMAIGAFVCAVMKLAPEKEVIKGIPINTIVMIVGVYMLLQVANQAGLVDAITAILHGNIPGLFIAGMLVIFAGFLAFFSSVNAVVLPLLFPLVPALCAAFGLDSVALYSCILYGGVMGASSPFSAAGALLCGSCPDEKTRDALPNQVIVLAIGSVILTAVLATLGVFNFLSV